MNLDVLTQEQRELFERYRVQYTDTQPARSVLTAIISSLTDQLASRSDRSAPGEPTPQVFKDTHSNMGGGWTMCDGCGARSKEIHPAGWAPIQIVWFDELSQHYAPVGWYCDRCKTRNWAHTGYFLPFEDMLDADKKGKEIFAPFEALRSCEHPDTFTLHELSAALQEARNIYLLERASSPSPAADRSAGAGKGKKE